MVRGLLKRAALGLLVSGGLLGAAEALLHLGDAPPAYQRDLLVRWQPRAFMHDVQLPNPAVGGSFTVSTNLDGLRSPHGPGEGARVWMSGDSTVFGWGVADHESLPSLLEEQLKQRSPHRAQVINGGQPSASTVSATQLALQLAPRYSADVVLAVLPYHDWFPAHVTDREYLSGGGRDPISAARYLLATRSQLFAWMFRTLRPDKPGLTQGLTTRVPDSDRRWALEQLMTLADQVFVVTLPTPGTMQLPGFANRGAGDRAWVASTCQELGCLPLDLSVVDGVDPATLVFEDDTAHFNAAGNAWLAERLAEGVAPALGGVR